MKSEDEKKVDREFTRLINSKDHSEIVSIISSLFDTYELRQFLIKRLDPIRKREIAENFVELHLPRSNERRPDF